MDSLLTSGAVARQLGVSVHRVLRAARSSQLRMVQRGNRSLFSPETLHQLRHLLGSAPGIEGLTRVEVFVLAALSRRPFGLGSARAVARVAGLSPTAAGRALHRLQQAGYVELVQIRVVEGVVRDVAVWRVQRESSAWLAVAPGVREVKLPTRARPSPPDPPGRPVRIPPRLGHLFWDQDLSRLDTARHGVLIANRVLRSEDPEGLAWMATNIAPDDLRHAARSRSLDRRRGRLAELLADAG